MNHPADLLSFFGGVLLILGEHYILYYIDAY